MFTQSFLFLVLTVFPLVTGQETMLPNVSCPLNLTTNLNLSAADCSTQKYCYLPSAVVVDSPKTSSCPTKSHILISLLLFNAFAAAADLFLGHRQGRHFVRRLTPEFLQFSDPNKWSFSGGILSAVLQIFAMVLSSAIARSGGFSVSYLALFGMWTMRPRIGFLTFLYRFVMNSPTGYEWTLRDVMVSEGLLNLFSIAFALHLLQLSRDAVSSLGTPTSKLADCMSSDFSECRIPGGITLLPSIFGWRVASGVLSAFYLAGMLVFHFGKEEYETDGMGSKKDYNHEKVGFLHPWVYILAVFMMVVNFITGWELWGIFVDVAGDHYCPGSVAGVGAVWGTVFGINAIMRPIVGGSSMG